MYRKARFLVWILVLLAGLLAGVSNAADPSLVAWWKLDDDGTGMIIDSSGNGHNGTLQGDAHFVPGINHEAVEFDGADDYVVIDGYKGVAGDGTNALAFTISAWIVKGGVKV